MANPHDRFFKSTFSQAENAMGEFQAVLPPYLIEQIDWSSLRLCPGSFVDRQFKELHSDLLYSVRLQQREAFIYVLMEHQSSSEVLMPLRMLGYVVRVLESFVKDNPQAKKLPAVIPVVLHHSQRGWSAPVKFTDIIDLDERTLSSAQKYLPTFEFVLDDLTKLSEAQLFGRAMTAAASFSLFCLKRAFYSGDFRKEIELATGAFRQVANAQNPIAALETILRYIMEVSEVPTDWLREFTSRKVGREAEEAYMTAAEQLRREGIQEGLQKGRAEVVLKLLTLRFGALSKEHTQRVKEASVETLDRFAERVLNANNISDVFDL
jgi:predicted transposase/invertase (TIGR01784 family)